jgi:hypothetical protein
MPCHDNHVGTKVKLLVARSVITAFAAFAALTAFATLTASATFSSAFTPVVSAIIAPVISTVVISTAAISTAAISTAVISAAAISTAAISTAVISAAAISTAVISAAAISTAVISAAVICPIITAAAAAAGSTTVATARSLLGVGALGTGFIRVFIRTSEKPQNPLGNAVITGRFVVRLLAFLSQRVVALDDQGGCDGDDRTCRPGDCSSPAPVAPTLHRGSNLE